MPTFRYDYFLEVVQEYTSTQGTPFYGHRLSCNIN